MALRVAHHLRLSHRRPGLVLLVGFALAIAVGTGLLLLPIATAGAESATLMQALFTAASATCITGLTIVETATFWSPFGHVVIIVLVQLGGFGVMTFATLLGIVILRRMSLRERLTAAAATKAMTLKDVRGLVIGVVVISLIVEACVAVPLMVRFALGYGEPLGQAVWHGIFHAVSSFNNAGFALFTGSMEKFVTDPFVCLPLCVATILGGLGFPVIMQLRSHFTSPRYWTVNTRIVLVATTGLIIAGAIFVTAIEWNNPSTLGPLGTPGKLLAGFFQSVQARTTGFTTVDIGALEPATRLGMDVLMFIGAGPAGTAGGIKITTFAVLVFIVVAEIRGEHTVTITGKQISHDVHRQAITVVMLSVGVLVSGTAVLLLVSGIDFDKALFEAVSAFGTTGFSTGITGKLPDAGQATLIALMYLGRLGPMTIATALALRERHTRFERPTERPIIG